MKKGLIFDLDGTLWDSSAQVVPAWNQALGRHPELGRQITEDEMRSYMGKTVEMITELMLPGIPREERLAILEECCAEERVYLLRHGGTLYPRLEETLITLQKNYLLYIVSNCNDGYIETFLEYHQMGRFFSDTECFGRTRRQKGENIRLIIERNDLGRAVYIGDTQGDLDAADLAGIPFIYASYGFGKVNRDVPSISQFSELPQTLPALFER